MRAFSFKKHQPLFPKEGGQIGEGEDGFRLFREPHAAQQFVLADELVIQGRADVQEEEQPQEGPAQPMQGAQSAAVEVACGICTRTRAAPNAWLSLPPVKGNSNVASGEVSYIVKSLVGSCLGFH